MADVISGVAITPKCFLFLAAACNKQEVFFVSPLIYKFKKLTA